MNVADSEYVRILIPEDQQQLAAEPILPSHVMSLHALRAQPIQEQCKLLLKDGNRIVLYSLPFTFYINFLFVLQQRLFSSNSW